MGNINKVNCKIVAYASTSDVPALIDVEMDTYTKGLRKQEEEV